MAMANFIIHRLHQAQDVRGLSLEEGWLRRTLKHPLLGLASLEHTIARQRPRIRWLKAGDANTQLFMAVANGRRSKNFITHVKHGDQIVTEQEELEEVFSDAYENILGHAHTREVTLDLDEMGMDTVQLQELEEIFTEEEVCAVIKELPPERAPGPDGFIGAF